MKKIISVILAIVILSSLCVTGAAANTTNGEWISVPFTSDLSSQAQNKIMIKWNWNDFTANASTSGENIDLAIAGLVLSNQAEMAKEDVENVLKTLGFTDMLSDYYASGTEHINDISNPARTFAHHEIEVNGVKKHIICAVFRGTTSAVDAQTDIKSIKDGFKGAGENCVESLKQYQNSLNGVTKENTILFITGHSLGASTASVVSLLAGDVADKSATHTYTIATPNYDTMGLKTEDYKNMHLYTNLDDPVPKVPVNYNKIGDEKFYRYGTLTLDEKVRFDRVYKFLRNKTYDEDGGINSTDVLGMIRDHMGFTYLSFILSEMTDEQIDSYIAPFEITSYKPSLSSAKQFGAYGIKASVNIYSLSKNPNYQFSIKKDGKWSSTSSGANTVTFKNLKKEKTYSVKVRVSKKINGKTYYSKWSAEKKVKINVRPADIKSYKPALKYAKKSGKNNIKVKAAKCKVCNKPTYQFAIKKNGKWKKSKSSSVTKTFKKLKKGKFYRVKVRVMKKINSKAYYSKWSKSKIVLIKK